VPHTASLCAAGRVGAELAAYTPKLLLSIFTTMKLLVTQLFVIVNTELRAQSPSYLTTISLVCF